MTPTSGRATRLLGYLTQEPSTLEKSALEAYADRFTDGADDSRFSTLGALLQGPVTFSDDGMWVAIEGDPIGHFGNGATSPGDVAHALLSAYRTHGPRCLERLHGGFSLALIDTRSRTALLAVDRMGVERMAYAASDGTLAFSSSVQAAAGIASDARRLRPQALFDYLLLHMVPSPDSVYEGVHKLRAGTYALFERGRLTTQSYWQPQFAEANVANSAELRRQIQDGLQAGVAASAPGEHSGAFLSGGLDSSSVAGMLCRVLDRPAPTFSIGFGIESYNELEYARIASRRYGSIPHEYEVTADDVVEAFPRIAAAYDEPFGNSSAVPTYFCARLAHEHGVTHLLAGDGGDEIFGGNERYARQKIFESYHSIPQWLRSGFIEPMSRLVDPDSRVMPLRKLRSYVDQARVPMPERLESWNFMYRASLDDMLDPDFHASVDPRAPFRRMAEVYEASQCKSLVNKMLFFDWQYTLADNDLRKVGTMCNLAGVRVSYPMLHPQLIDVSLRTPPGLKVQGMKLRVLYKQAMADFLPAEIISKPKHGFGLPFGHWLKTHQGLGEMIYSYLGELKKRHMIRAEFLDQLIADHRSGHPSYFGYAIWDLAMLEAWLQARQVR